MLYTKMKNLIYCIIGLFLISCAPPKETVFVTCDLGNYYEVSIPEFFDSRELNINDISCWHAEEEYAFLYVYYEAKDSKTRLNALVNEKLKSYKDLGFYCSKENLSDSTTTIKFSKGMLYGKCHLVVRKVEFGHYIVSYESVKGCSFEDTKKIASSIKLRIKESKPTETQTTNKETTSNAPKYAVYKNNLYSVGYPLDWSYLERPDGISDVYIGSNTEMLGFTILHVDNVEMTLKQIVDQSNADGSAYGLKVIECTPTKVCGLNAYKTVIVGELMGRKIKNVSYSFLTTQGTFYNIKFGNDTQLIDKNSLLISRILNSFKLNTPDKPAAQSKLTTQKNSSTIALDKTFGNKYFTVNYPSNWEIVNEDANTVRDIDISVQVMQKRTNDTDFLPNVNIIKSPQKRPEPALELAKITLNQLMQVISIEDVTSDSVNVSGCKGVIVTYKAELQGFPLEWYQYIVKKPDNTTYTITCTIDQTKRITQKPIVDAIVKSCIIK